MWGSEYFHVNTKSSPVSLVPRSRRATIVFTLSTQHAKLFLS